MTSAYGGGVNNPSQLKLTRPLNAFSFTIPGFNDVNSVSDPTIYMWKNATVSLTGYWRVLKS
jgi:hypothetical protein